MIKNNDEKDEYKAMMKGMISQLEKRNIKVIQASLEGYEQPEIIEKRKPDIIGIDNDGKRIIVDVEADKTKEMMDIKERFIEFSQADGEFWIEVPESYSKKLLEKVKEWRVPVDKWFVGQGL